jgi:hypothetical protein
VVRDVAARQVLGPFRECGLMFESLMIVLHQLVATIQHCVSIVSALPSLRTCSYIASVTMDLSLRLEPGRATGVMFSGTMALL